jgi:hypothetical protein
MAAEAPVDGGGYLSKRLYESCGILLVGSLFCCLLIVTEIIMAT